MRGLGDVACLPGSGPLQPGQSYCTDLLTRAGQLSDAETAALVAQVNASNTPAGLFGMDATTTWLLAGVAGLVVLGMLRR
jgi:hypothetical protein